MCTYTRDLAVYSLHTQEAVDIFQSDDTAVADKFLHISRKTQRGSIYLQLYFEISLPFNKTTDKTIELFCNMAIIFPSIISV